MIQIAVIGYGIVGSGVAEVIRRNSTSIAERAGKKISIKKILDIRDFIDSPDQDVLTKNADEIFEDTSIEIVVETIGGVGVAYEFTKRALTAGKHVVTSNKELVATHGPELLQLACHHRVNYMFEASVGGGIPIIRPLHQCLAANEIHEIAGILNGTTNYILTQMKRAGKDFNEALKEAQAKGYAEANPTADIEGHDACRKIAILSSIAFNEYVDYREIHTEGITNITRTDMKYAEELNRVIKLIGIGYKENEKVFARVCPVMLSKNSSLANVEDVFNAILVKGDAIGEAMFYGRGAGKLPTASAVVADIIDIVKRPESYCKSTWVKKEGNMMDFNYTQTKYFVRVKADDLTETKKVVNQIFGSVKWVHPNWNEAENELAFVTEVDTELQCKARFEALNKDGRVSVINTLRLMEE